MIPKPFMGLRVSLIPGVSGRKTLLRRVGCFCCLHCVPNGLPGWTSQLGHPHGGRLRARMSRLGLQPLSCPPVRETGKCDLRFRSLVVLVQEEVVTPWPTR